MSGRRRGVDRYAGASLRHQPLVEARDRVVQEAGGECQQVDRLGCRVDCFLPQGDRDRAAVREELGELGAGRRGGAWIVLGRGPQEDLVDGQESRRLEAMTAMGDSVLGDPALDRLRVYAQLFAEISRCHAGLHERGPKTLVGHRASRA